jgi:hypothetical protein
MIDWTSLSLLKRTIRCCVFQENIVLEDIIQNLLNLRMNYSCMKFYRCVCWFPIVLYIF